MVTGSMNAVIFDLFGTLVDNLEPKAWRSAFNAIAAHLGARPKEFWTAWGSTYRSRMNGSLLDDDHVFAGTMDALGLSATPNKLVEAACMRTEFMRSALRARADALPCLMRIQTAGLKLALATDCTSGTPALLDETPLGHFFPIRAISSHLGVTKPDPLMYEHVLKSLAANGSECMYVGDGNSEELLGAKRHGMTTVWLDNGVNQHHRERHVPEGDHTVSALSEVPLLLGLG